MKTCSFGRPARKNCQKSAHASNFHFRFFFSAQQTAVIFVVVTGARWQHASARKNRWRVHTSQFRSACEQVFLVMENLLVWTELYMITLNIVRHYHGSKCRPLTARLRGELFAEHVGKGVKQIELRSADRRQFP